MIYHVIKQFIVALGITIACILSAGAAETSQRTLTAYKQLKTVEILSDSESMNFAFEFYYRQEAGMGIVFVNGEKSFSSDQNQTLSTIKIPNYFLVNEDYVIYLNEENRNESDDCFFIRYKLDTKPMLGDSPFERMFFHYKDFLPFMNNGKLTLSFNSIIDNKQENPFSFVKKS